MRLFVLGCAAVTAAVAATAPLGTPNEVRSASQGTRPPRLFKDSRQQIAIARAQGRTSIVLVVATLPGRAGDAARDAQRLGGDVRFRDDSVGYLRVRLPLDQATAFAESPGVEAAAGDVDDSYPTRLSGDGGAAPVAGDGDRGTLQAGSEPWPPRLGDYPLRNAYSPLKDLDAAGFRAQNPTFDGRGVTIAVLDGNIDMLLPEFQTAYALDGKRIPKFTDYLNVTDPRDDLSLTPQWVDMKAQVDATDGKATYAGKTFTLPRAGHFRIGLFDERRFNEPANLAYIDQDVDRSGNPAGDDGLFGVLWDEGSNDVWVDTDRDLDFTDEKSMTDYVVRNDFGVFGNDNPATPIRESIGFAVQTDRVNKFISINVGAYQHATTIMGSVVGNPEPNGRLHGVAPGARLLSMYYGTGIMHAAIEGMIQAFRRPDVDLIVFEQSVFMASIPYLIADGRHPLSVIAGRLATRYQKLMFVPGSNSPGFGIVAEDGLAPNVVSVGAYQSSDSYLVNKGMALEGHDNLHWGGLSHGPSGTGALKPDLLAPSGQLGTEVGYRKGGMAPGLYQLPPGYGVDGGTSTATPMASGATALVLSAAKQRGLKYDAVRLKAAMAGAARFIPSLGANEQGGGLVQVGAAFARLEQLQGALPPTITSRAPVRTALSGLLWPPNEGVGLFEREGWKVGDRGDREITLTRTSGAPGAMRFDVRWLGNDGTFEVPTTVILPLNQPTRIPVRIVAATSGVHSATLELTTTGVAGLVHRVLCTIVAATPLSAANGFAATTTVSVPKARDRSVFVDVPAGASALTFQAPVAIRFAAVSPTRDYTYPCSYGPATAPCAIPNPEPGVWEINVANNDFSAISDGAAPPPKPMVVAVQATALGVDVTSPARAAWLATDGAASFPVRMANRMGGARHIVAAGAVGSAFRQTRTISQGEQHAYQIDVPKGATSLSAMVQVADGSADLDVYLLDCTTLGGTSAGPPYDRQRGGKAPAVPEATCTPREKAAAFTRSATVEVDNPAPGRWTVVVDGYRVQGGSVSYSYVDVFTDPRLGALALADAPGDRAPNAEWSAAAHGWTAVLPTTPRVAVGRIVLTSADVNETLVDATGRRTRLVPLGSALLFADALPANGSAKEPAAGPRQRERR